MTERASQLLDVIRAVTGALDVREAEVVQRLWSGYGEIRRFELTGCDIPSVIVKRVTPPNLDTLEHPRGWASRRSHERKLESYRVECEWYRTYAARCDSTCRVPAALHLGDTDEASDGWLFVLEDLDSSGFGARRGHARRREIETCLRWLAHFHARFLGAAPCGLWSEGTYWHLATRPDELEVMDDVALRNAAPEIDRRLREARFRTLVHGDAKLANFCFAERGASVAAVDFQYVGGGCGMKDVAYFFSSCLSETELAREADELLDVYFKFLGSALEGAHLADRDAIESEWRALYPMAWADFFRFLNGWAPGHAKVHGYSRSITQQALAQL